MLLHLIRYNKTMEGEKNMEGTIIIEVKEDVAPNAKEIGKVVVAYVHPVISHTTVGHIEFVSTQVLTAEPLQRVTRIIRFGATKCQGANATAPDSSG